MEKVINQDEIRRVEVHGASPYECESTAPSLAGTITINSFFTAPENTAALRNLGPKAISVPSYGVFR